MTNNDTKFPTTLDLKCCPFCGAQKDDRNLCIEVTGSKENGFGIAFYVFCGTCGTSGPRINKCNGDGNVDLPWSTAPGAMRYVAERWNQRWSDIVEE